MYEVNVCETEEDSQQSLAPTARKKKRRDSVTNLSGLIENATTALKNINKVDNKQNQTTNEAFGRYVSHCTKYKFVIVFRNTFYQFIGYA